MTNGFLVSVPHEGLHGAISILEQRPELPTNMCKAWAVKDVVPLIAYCMCIAQCAPAQLPGDHWPGKPALLNRQGMGAHSKLHREQLLTHLPDAAVNSRQSSRLHNPATAGRQCLYLVAVHPIQQTAPSLQQSLSTPSLDCQRPIADLQSLALDCTNDLSTPGPEVKYKWRTASLIAIAMALDGMRNDIALRGSITAL